LSEDLLFTRSGKVATITLNRPDRLNAFSVAMIEAWLAALEEVHRDPDIHVLLVTGAGRAFCAGGDVKAMASGTGFLAGQGEEAATPLGVKASLWGLIQRIPLTLETLDKPVIAAVNGDAMGAGCDMALMCDLRFASDRARFGESYVRVGLVPGDGGAYFLPRLVGVPKALEMLWTGEMIDAREAERIGLVNRVVPHDDLMATGMEMAERLARGPQMAIRAIKRAVYQGLTSNLRTALDSISSQMALIAQTEDYHEGVRAVLERRPPAFK
jgi:enoyl-CoA hydratase/carnithine racemase